MHDLAVIDSHLDDPALGQDEDGAVERQILVIVVEVAVLQKLSDLPSVSFLEESKRLLRIDPADKGDAGDFIELRDIQRPHVNEILVEQIEGLSNLPSKKFQEHDLGFLVL